MKKILITIGALTVLCIVAFIVYYPIARGRPDVVYSSLVTYQDVTYKTVDSKDLKLDIMMPTKEVYTDVPYVVYLHDGDFTDGDKSNLLSEINQQVVFNLLDAGYAVVPINFRLLNSTVHFPDNLVDIKDALRFLNKNAVTYGFDSNNVGLWGKGTGAYLALTAGYSTSGAFVGETSLRSYNSNVIYVIEMSGLMTLNQNIDYSTMTNDQIFETQNRLETLFGAVYDISNLTAQDYSDMGRYNPTEYISYDTVPTLIIQGDSDEVYAVNNADLLKAKLDEYQLNYTYTSIPGGTHDLVNINDLFVTNIWTSMNTFLGSQYISPTS